MKKIAVVILLIIFGCEKSTKPITNSHNPVTVYTWDEYEKAKRQNPKRKIIVIDTICPFAINEAQKHIKNDSLVYYSRSYTPEVVEELKILLKPYRVFPEYRSTSCILPPEGFSDNCYGKTMDNEIAKRFGENWIDSMQRVALKNYIIKNPDKPYIEDGIDIRRKILNER